MPNSALPAAYWNYTTKTEKLGTIFIHLLVEAFTNAHAIYENHAGCERGYFETPLGEYLALEKYLDGDKSQQVFIPDLILFDGDRNEIIIIEGKTFEKRKEGIEQLDNYDSLENAYIKGHYNPQQIIRTVVTYGSQETDITEPEIGFMLNKDGIPVLGRQAPQIFTDAVNNMLASS